jgi:uncharacterized membrane protein
MLIVLDILPNLNTETIAFVNDRFLGLMILALFHFVLSWYWRADHHKYIKDQYNHSQTLFLTTSLLTWLYAFVTELRFFYAVDEFLLIELIMASTAVVVLAFGNIKNNVQYKIASVAIVLLMFFPMTLAPLADSSLPMVFNVSFLGYFVYAITQLAMSWYWQRDIHLNNDSTKTWCLSVSNVMLFSGLAAWYLRGMYELNTYLHYEFILSASLIFILVSTLVFILMAHKLNWKSLHLIKYAYLPMLLIAAFLVLALSKTYHQGYGMYAWLASAIFNYWLLRIYDKSDFKSINIYHIVGLFLFSFIAIFEFAELIEHFFTKASIWHKASYSLMLVLISMGLYFVRNLKKWPLTQYYEAYIKTSLPVLVMISWLLMLLVNLSPPGSLKSLAYMPVMNPIDITALLTLLLSWKMLKNDSKAFFVDTIKPVAITLASLSFILINASMLRGFHYWYEIPYKWSTMWSSFMIQTGFSILWTLTAMVLMIVSARKKWRIGWLVGLGLIIAVVIKLFLVDMSASGTIERIVAFLTVGILLSVVGYFSPIPPDQKSEKISEELKESVVEEK